MNINLYSYVGCSTHFADIVSIPVKWIEPGVTVELKPNSINYWITDVVHNDTNLEVSLSKDFFNYNNTFIVVNLGHENVTLGPHSRISDRINYILSHIPENRIIFQLGTECQLAYFKKFYPNLTNCMIFNYWEYWTRAKLECIEKVEHNPEHQQRFLFMNRRNYANRMYMFGLLWSSESFRNNSYTSFNPGNYWAPDDNRNHKLMLTALLSDIKADSGVREVFGKFILPQLPERYSSNDPYQYSMFDKSLLQAYADTHINIIVESNAYSIDQQFFPTEKLYRAIGTGSPFMVYAQPNYYQNLKTMGYQTYEEILGETHDSISDDLARARSLASAVLRLSDLDHKQFRKLVKQTSDIVAHNQYIFTERTQLDQIAKEFPKPLYPLKDHLRYVPY